MFIAKMSFLSFLLEAFLNYSELLLSKKYFWFFFSLSTSNEENTVYNNLDFMVSFYGFILKIF